MLSGGRGTADDVNGFWLSHHPPDQGMRAYDFGGIHVCARCLGTYPMLFAVLLAQLRHRTASAWQHDIAFACLLTLPALVDWAVGQRWPRWGPKGLRTLSGMGLGVALGRTLYVHLIHPLPQALLAQAALVTAVAGPVMIWNFWRRPR